MLSDRKRLAPLRKSADWCSRSADKDEVELNVVLLGAPRVGKSSLVSQFLWRIFKSAYKSTVEDFNWIEYEVDGTKTFWLKLVDTSGSRDFLAMRDLNIKNADAFLLVFALDDAESLEEAKDLMKLILKLNEKSASIILVANKADTGLDMEKFQKIWLEAEQFAENSKCSLMKVSAKDYDSVELLFHQLITRSCCAGALQHMKKRRQSNPTDSEIAAEFDHANSDRHAKHSCSLS